MKSRGKGKKILKKREAIYKEQVAAAKAEADRIFNANLELGNRLDQVSGEMFKMKKAMGGNAVDRIAVLDETLKFQNWGDERSAALMEAYIRSSQYFLNSEPVDIDKVFYGLASFVATFNMQHELLMADAMKKFEKGEILQNKSQWENMSRIAKCMEVTLRNLAASGAIKDPLNVNSINQIADNMYSIKNETLRQRAAEKRTNLINTLNIVKTERSEEIKEAAIDYANLMTTSFNEGTEAQKLYTNYQVEKIYER